MDAQFTMPTGLARGTWHLTRKVNLYYLSPETKNKRGLELNLFEKNNCIWIVIAEAKMSDKFEEKIKNYRTAPFDARFPNTNQTRNCYQNYLDFHRCNKALSAKNQDTAPCDWYRRVYKSLCPMSWVQKWDDQLESGSFAGRI